MSRKGLSEIRDQLIERHNNGETQVALAKEFGVTQAAIRNQIFWEESQEKGKEYHKKNRDRILEFQKTYYQEHKEETKIKNQRNHFKRKYGITIDEYNLMFDKQNGLCLICGESENKIGMGTDRTQMLSVDHNHETNEIRGLLCHSCNLALGNFKDKIENLENAIRYLKSFE